MAKPSCMKVLWLGVLFIAVAGCGEEEVVGIPHTHQADFEVTLCGLCGHVKGSDKCCKEGATVCPICGLNKGSILCCSTAINGRRDAILCKKCGEKVFSKTCCKDGFKICPKCGLHKDSPGCCKIDRVVADDTGHAVPAKADVHN